MKKLFNIVLIIIIGVTIWYVTNRFHQKDISDYTHKLDSLNIQLSEKNGQLKLINDTLKEVRQARIIDQENYDREKRNLIRDFNKNKEQVKGLPLTEMLQYILDYFGSNEAEIIQKGDTVLVMISPNLVNSIGLDIADHRDNLEKLKATETTLQAADNLIQKFNQEVPLLELKISTQKEIINNLTGQNELKDETIKFKDKEIQKYKIQRALIIGGSIVGFILIAL